ncbi:thioredoxin family protein [uncultured Traorella sp.]|uniref:thioredoxin family protein n=1 Tax=uncultured Traorella sp. TaxID=1929048 RepID=UPI0025E4094F|nr:thioredoxin family protein [uncultured Traorella sp.]
MKLFKRSNRENACCCAGQCKEENMQKAESQKEGAGIKILGSGCMKCIQLEKAARQAVQELNLDLKIEHITDFAQIASFGVMSTPALVLNGKVVSYGKVLSADEIKDILKHN